VTQGGDFRRPEVFIHNLVTKDSLVIRPTKFEDDVISQDNGEDLFYNFQNPKAVLCLSHMGNGMFAERLEELKEACNNLDHWLDCNCNQLTMQRALVIDDNDRDKGEKAASRIYKTQKECCFHYEVLKIRDVDWLQGYWSQGSDRCPRYHAKVYVGKSKDAEISFSQLEKKIGNCFATILFA
jgi:hypothetical protein